MQYFTEQPLAVIGATGKLASELVFYSLIKHFSPHLLLCGGSMERLKGLRDEIEESDFGDIQIELTLSMEEAVAQGGYLLFAKSVPGGAKTREEMLLSNAPYAIEGGKALAKAPKKIERVVCVSNPSDLMGLLLLLHSGLPPQKVVSLSSLDTTRYQRTLRRRLGVAPTEISEAYTLGSHDLAMAPMLDMARVKGKALRDIGVSEAEEQEIVKEIRGAGIDIYRKRGQTAYQSPAIHVLRILMATDQAPFLLPTARYHHSTRYPYTFGSLPTRIDSTGCHHLPYKYSDRDLQALDTAFHSIERMKTELIRSELLPPTTEWPEALQVITDLVEIM